MPIFGELKRSLKRSFGYDYLSGERDESGKRRRA